MKCMTLYMRYTSSRTCAEKLSQGLDSVGYIRLMKGTLNVQVKVNWVSLYIRGFVQVDRRYVTSSVLPLISSSGDDAIPILEPQPEYEFFDIRTEHIPIPTIRISIFAHAYHFS